MDEQKTQVIDPKPVRIPDLDQLPGEIVTPYRIRTDREDAEREMALNPGNFTPEKIKKWKTLGIERPQWVPLNDWKMGEEAIKPLHRIICHLAAVGMETKDIAQTAGVSETFVRKVIHSGTGESEIERIQDKVWGKSFKQTIEDILPVAIQTAVKTMLDPKTKASTKVAAAFAFMDRSMGKPTQTVEVSSNMLRQVYEMLDAQVGQRPVIDVPSADQKTPALTEQKTVDTVNEERNFKDPIDSWVEDNL